ncbi:MAG: hypothetical protein U0575_06955 [Phycisphaerales bacterium]
MSIKTVVRSRALGAAAFASSMLIGGVALGQSFPCVWDAAPGVPGFENLYGDAWVMSSVIHDDGAGPALYAAGAFTSVGGRATGGIARWDGAAWQPVGGGVSGYVATLVEYDDGSGTKLVAGGAFEPVGLPGVQRVAAWDGTRWSALGDGLIALGSEGAGPQWVRSLAVFDDGAGPKLYAGTNFDIWNVPGAKRMARYDGAQWHAVPGDPTPSGLPFSTAEVTALASFDDGSGPALYAGGNDLGDALALARFDGASWTSLGPTSGRVDALVVHDDGSGAALYVGGLFSQVAGVPIKNLARLDGSSRSSGGSWSALPGVVLGQGDEIACFAPHAIDGVPQLVMGRRDHDATDITGRLLAWDGVSLHALLGSMTADAMAFPYLPWSITTLASLPNPTGTTLFVAGQFTEVDGIDVKHAAFWNASPIGDLDCDGLVGAADLGLLLAAWATDAAAADLDGSGTVDGADLGALLGNWG